MRSIYHRETIYNTGRHQHMRSSHLLEQWCGFSWKLCCKLSEHFFLRGRQFLFATHFVCQWWDWNIYFHGYDHNDSSCFRRYTKLRHPLYPFSESRQYFDHGSDSHSQVRTRHERAISVTRRTELNHSIKYKNMPSTASFHMVSVVVGCMKYGDIEEVSWGVHISNV